MKDEKMYSKYPRSYHLPWSPGGTNDDKRMDDVSGLLNVPVVITEKMDGGNVCLEVNNCFARSHGQPPSHRSYDSLKAFHARVKHLIKPDVQLFGEWLYAKHSIHYADLPHYLMLIGIRNKVTGIWSPWHDVVEASELIGVPTVPLLAFGHYKTVKDLEKGTNGFATDSSSFGDREGVVVRLMDGFADEDFGKYVGKWVRKGHVVSNGKHWKHKAIEKNGLAK
jgi:hypothetical protein